MGVWLAELGWGRCPCQNGAYQSLIPPQFHGTRPEVVPGWGRGLVTSFLRP